jgi:hypothetical protein
MEIFIIAASGTAVLAVLLLTAVPWRHADATARDFSWRRRIDISQQVWVRTTGSSAPPPPSARNVRKTQRLVPHTTSTAMRANGWSSTSYRPETVYSYEVPQWQRARTVTAAGEGQAGVRWPACDLKENEREGRKAETYRAAFESTAGKRYTARLSEAAWLSLKAGTSYPLKLNALGRVLKVGNPSD